ncbi:MAG TPA: sensor domain-containing diguanylate cyclase [Trichocoleus sp.]
MSVYPFFPDPVKPFQGFREAAQHILKFLQAQLGFGLWMITRTEGQDWIVLVSESSVYSVHDGDVLRWTDSFCDRMVRGEGPQIAPRSVEIEAYAAAPISRQLSIAAYIGIPLQWPDGSLFGTLCAIDPHPQPDAIEQALPLLHLQARLLSTLLATEMNYQAVSRSLQQARHEAQVDFLTGLYNRRGWEGALTVEEERCKTFGSPALVLTMDLDNLKQANDSLGHAHGDQLIRQAADCLKRAVGQTDIVARLGGDEFAVLVVEFKGPDKNQVVSRVQTALQRAGISASIGWAVRSPRMTLAETARQADKQMYLCKRQRKASCL